MTTHYQLLGVSPNASVAEIKHRYRRLSLENHPDRGGSQEKMTHLNEAYRVLSDASLRREYDKSLAAATPKATAHTYGQDTTVARPRPPYPSRRRRDFRKPKKTAAYWVWHSMTK